MAEKKLAAVGPVDPGNGFPRWYEDESGVRLALGLDPDDPNIAALEVGPGAIVFPTNYPGEAFYFLVEAEVPIGGTAGDGRAKLVLGLEATFAGLGEPAPDQQIVFGRTRLRIQNGRPETEYTFTHPYGAHTASTDDRGKVDVTVDIGVAPGQFADALGAGVAPFLRWTSGAALGAGEGEPPDGYLGIHGTPHTVTGSPEETNFFRVEGIGAATGSGQPESSETALFSLQGKVATEIGAQVVRAVRPAPGAADVFAFSAPGQELVVTGDGVPVTVMRGVGRNYAARVSTAADEIEVLNRTRGGGSGPTPVTDLVTVETATFDLDAVPSVLRVRAVSSGTAPLELVGFGPIANGVDETFAVDAPPASVQVSVAGKVLATREVVLDGAASVSESPTAVITVTTPAGVRSHVTPGEEVTLDSSGSTGALVNRTWTASGGGQIADATAAATTLTMPLAPGSVSVTLTVTDTAGRTADTKTDVTLTVTDTAGRTADTKTDVTVEAPRAPLAHPGADRTVDVGEPVTLDAGASLGARTFRWTTPDGDAADIDGPDSMQPTVTLRRGGPVSLQLTVTGPGGPDSVADVVLTGRPGTVAIDRAEYRTDKKQWRVSGRASGPDPARRRPDRVTVSTPLGGLGEAVVDAAGAWSLVAGLVGSAPLAGDRVTAGSRHGGVAEAPLTVRR
ncbi:hypothetical protein [Actinomycetospora termitidis]|uniref:PKD domain-containing protein n=1 Tax=Actinomycetospora termitidis TaxID=3053470 RepID=A0ABT7MGV9_9PSEU|nr:hypothetical protein [Actinomycetospora sp. Odt1-22]MDL5159924.1 hypothetical protein [Actinomycetospora sp. Odt1-22]